MRIWILLLLTTVSLIAHAVPVEDVFQHKNLSFTLNESNAVVEQRGGTSSYTHPPNMTAFARSIDSFDPGMKGWGEQMYRSVQNNTYASLPVERRVTVYTVSSIYENVDTELYVTKKTLAVTPTTNRSPLHLIEAPPPAEVNTTPYHTVVPDRHGAAYRWTFQNVSAGKEYNVTYYVSTIIVGESTQAFAFAPFQPVTTSGGHSTSGKTEQRFKRVDTAPLPSGTVSWLLSILAVAFGILVITGIIFELETAGKLRGLKDLWRDLVAFVNVGFRNKRLIDEYIESCLDQGHHPDDIHIQLVRAGWNRTAVRHLIRKYR